MADNHCKLIGLYDELSSFLTQINLYKSRGLSDSHDLALFLQLYNGHPWARKTGRFPANFPPCMHCKQWSILISGLLSCHFSTQICIAVTSTIAVTGDANFVMESTSLTIGGFTQPAVARSLIELPSNIEKGLCTRFLWIFPEPCYAKFASLEPVNGQFTVALGKCWVSGC